MAVEKIYWTLVSPRSLVDFWRMPYEIAFNPNYKFYRGDSEIYDEDFHLIAFLFFPEDEKHLIFRFWRINEGFLDPDWKWDIFAGRGVGWLSLGRKALEDLITLLSEHTQDLVDTPELQSVFQLIPEKDYPTYAIRLVSPSDDSLFYLYSAVDGIESDHINVFFNCTGRVSYSFHMETIQAPKVITDPKGFWHAMDESNGSLTLTKRGAEEFCQILRERLPFIK